VKIPNDFRKWSTCRSRGMVVPTAIELGLLDATETLLRRKRLNETEVRQWVQGGYSKTTLRCISCKSKKEPMVDLKPSAGKIGHHIPVQSFQNLYFSSRWGSVTPRDLTS